MLKSWKQEFNGKNDGFSDLNLFEWTRMWFLDVGWKKSDFDEKEIFFELFMAGKKIESFRKDLFLTCLKIQIALDTNKYWNGNLRNVSDGIH